jgi:hypothetical protein
MGWLTALLGVGGSLLSGILGQQGADKASKQQAAATAGAIKGTQAATTKSVEMLAPWMSAGKAALAQYQGELGLSKTGADGQPFQSQFRETPGYQYDVQQAEKGAVNNMRALGLGGSGAALKALTGVRMGLADKTYNNYLDRLNGVSNNGQAAAGTSANVLMGGNETINNDLISLGSQQASGTVGSTNSWLGALSNGVNGVGKALGSYGSDWISALGGGGSTRGGNVQGT